MAPTTGYGVGGYVTCGTTAVTVNNLSWGSSNQWVVSAGSTGGTIVYGNDYWHGSDGKYLDKKDGKLVAPKGEDLLLPDGTVIKVDDLGNYKIEDKEAKVVYEAARMREFNPFVNASDLLASFIRDVGALGITKEELGKLPIPLLINWLVVKAAEQDNDPIPEGVTPIEQHPVLLRLMPKSEKAA